MTPNPDAPRGPSIRLTEELMGRLGLTCIWLDRISTGAGDETRLLKRSIVARRAIGDKLWFRNEKEADQVFKAVLSRTFEVSRARDKMGRRIPGGALLARMPYDALVETIRTIAFTLGVTPINDQDVATTFDSIHRRIGAVLLRMEYDGSIRQLHRQYAALRRVTLSGDKGDIRGDKGDIGDKSLPSYSNWLFDRLKTELSRCADLVQVTKL
jgi:hypothetical protein